MKRPDLWLATLLLFAVPAQAQAQVQTQVQTAPTVSASKRQLIDQILQAQQAGIDQLARQLVEQPAMQLMQRAAAVVRRNVAVDKQEAMGQAVQAEVQKFAQEAFPLVRDRARALAPVTIGPLLAEKMTESELQEVVAVLRSPAWRKFEALGSELQKALGERLVTDVKPQMETRLKALDQTLAQRLGLTSPAAASGAASAK